MNLTWIELLIILVILAIVWVATFIIYKLFHQTDLLGTLKWGFLLVALGAGTHTKSKS